LNPATILAILDVLIRLAELTENLAKLSGMTPEQTEEHIRIQTQVRKLKLELAESAVPTDRGSIEPPHES